MFDIFHILRVTQPFRLVEQEPEPSQATVMALACCFLGKVLGVGYHYFTPPLDIPIIAARYLHVCTRQEILVPKGWHYGREYCQLHLTEMTTYTSFWNPLHAPQITTLDRRLYFPSEGRRAEDFFRHKNPRTRVPGASTLTSRPPKPVSFILRALIRFIWIYKKTNKCSSDMRH